MIKSREIRQVLRSQLIAGTGASLPVHRRWENREFTPPQGETFIEDYLLPGPEALVATGTLKYDGIYQINVVAPIHAGSEAPEDLADTIKNAFIPANYYDADGQPPRVEIVRSWRGQGRADAGIYYRIPVFVSFWSTQTKS